MGALEEFNGHEWTQQKYGNCILCAVVSVTINNNEYGYVYCA